MNRSLSMCVLVCSLAASAGDAPKLKGALKKEAPRFDLGLPKFSELPKGDDLRKVKVKQEDQETHSTPAGEKPCSLVLVQSAKGFVRSPAGAKPAAPFPAATATGNPLTMEKFISVVRVKCTDKRNRQIEVAVLDQGGDTIMDASGELLFGGQEQTDWQVDWDQTSIRRAGEFQILVRVGGEPLGTAPLKVEAR